MNFFVEHEERKQKKAQWITLYSKVEGIYYRILYETNNTYQGILY